MGLSTGQTVALGLPVLLLGLALVWGALRLFRATGQNPKPWHATPEIIRTGVYRFTRNPMYLGLALIQTAIGIGLGNLWVLLFVPLVCLIVQYTAIRPEEVYLERKFGRAYLDYRERVRRWF
jgi:protein-S-isoprenylcysteine O-methyltransferase Ste14